MRAGVEILSSARTRSNRAGCASCTARRQDSFTSMILPARSSTAIWSCTEPRPPHAILRSRPGARLACRHSSSNAAKIRMSRRSRRGTRRSTARSRSDLPCRRDRGRSALPRSRLRRREGRAAGAGNAETGWSPRRASAGREQQPPTVRSHRCGERENTKQTAARQW